MSFQPPPYMQNQNAWGTGAPEVSEEEAISNYQAQVAMDGDTRNDWLTHMSPDVAAEMVRRYEGGGGVPGEQSGMEGYGEPAPVADIPNPDTFGTGGGGRAFYEKPKNAELYGGFNAALARGQEMFTPEQQADPMMGLAGASQEPAPTTAQLNQEWAMANRPQPAQPPAEALAQAGQGTGGASALSDTIREKFPRAAHMVDTLQGNDLREQARNVRRAKTIGNFELEKMGGGQPVRQKRPASGGGGPTGY